jgi:hypothetical protein
MKSFIYKSLIIIASIILVFEFTIGNKISQVYEKIDVLSTKQGRPHWLNKIREEIKKAVNK